MSEPRHRARLDRELSQSLLAAVVLVALALMAWAVAGLARTVNHAVTAALDPVRAAFDRGSSTPDGYAEVTLRSGDYVAFVVVGAADLEPWLETLVGVPLSRPMLDSRVLYATRNLNRKLVFSQDLGRDPDVGADAQAAELMPEGGSVAAPGPTSLWDSDPSASAALGFGSNEGILRPAVLRFKSSVMRIAATAPQIVVTDGDGTADLVVPVGSYAFCSIGVFPHENDLIACTRDVVEITGDTTLVLALSFLSDYRPPMH